MSWRGVQYLKGRPRRRAQKVIKLEFCWGRQATSHDAQVLCCKRMQWASVRKLLKAVLWAAGNAMHNAQGILLQNQAIGKSRSITRCSAGGGRQHDTPVFWQE